MRLLRAKLLVGLAFAAAAAATARAAPADSFCAAQAGAEHDGVLVHEAFLNDQDVAAILSRIDGKSTPAARGSTQLRELMAVPGWLSNSLLSVLGRGGGKQDDLPKEAAAADEVLLPVYAMLGNNPEHQDRVVSGPNSGRLAEGHVGVLYLEGDGDFVLTELDGVGTERRVPIEPGKLISWPNAGFSHRVEGASPGLWRRMLGPMAIDAVSRGLVGVGGFSPTPSPTSPTMSPTASPTSMPTTAPTPFPTTPLYARVTEDTYCGNGETVPIPVRRRLAAEEEADRHRALATTPVELCYAACYSFYAPPPNNAQFLFQLVDLGQGRVCQCCKTCQPQLALQGALLMEACVPNALLRTTPKISRKSVRASGTKPVYVTYTLRIRSNAKSLELRDMGVQITLPQGASVVKTAPSSVDVDVSGSTVTFYPLVFNTKTRTFRGRVKLTPPFTGTNSLVFQGMVFQNAYDLAQAPYCPLPANDVVVTVK